MSTINLVLKSNIDRNESCVSLSNADLCGAVLELVGKTHPKLASTVRVDLHATTDHIILVVDYLRHHGDETWVGKWLSSLKPESSFSVLVIAVALKIQPLCRLLYQKVDHKAPVDSRTVEDFFKTMQIANVQT